MDCSLPPNNKSTITSAGSLFPPDWTLLLSFRLLHTGGSAAVVVSLTDPTGRGDNLSLSLAGVEGRQGELGLQLRHWTANTSRSVYIPARIRNNTWTQLAIR